MKRKLIAFLAVTACVFFSVQMLFAAGHVPEKGEIFPEITLPVPERTHETEYLGIKEKTHFMISQINADLIIVEIFSMYCPYCQKEAPNVNELFALIEKSEKYSCRVKIIGIGAGNTPFEVDVFRKQYNIRFPLFSDETFSIHKKIGEVRTPHFFVIRNTPDGKGKVVYSEVGSIQDPAKFLERIIREAAIRQEE